MRIAKSVAQSSIGKESNFWLKESWTAWLAIGGLSNITLSMSLGKTLASIVENMSLFFVKSVSSLPTLIRFNRVDDKVESLDTGITNLDVVENGFNRHTNS